MKHWIRALTAVSLVFVPLAGGTASEAAGAGSVTGTLKANGKVVTLKFAQAKREGKEWLVLLSDVPTSFAEPDERGLVESGKLHSLTLTVGADGVSYWRMAHDAIEAKFLSTSSVTFSKVTTLGPDFVEGQAKKAADKYGDTTVEFDVTFKAPIRK
jgi:hypothetical protein